MLTDVSAVAQAVRHDGLDVPARELLRQRPHGKLLGHAENRTDTPATLLDSPAGATGDHRIHPDFLQPPAATFPTRLSIASGLCPTVLQDATLSMMRFMASTFDDRGHADLYSRRVIGPCPSVRPEGLRIAYRFRKQ